MKQLKRVGHKGADLIEPGNTVASFDAALRHGVDMIELDVLPERGSGLLLLAHDYDDLAEREPLTLGEGLAHLSGEPFAGLELIVDLKLPGYERQVVDALHEHQLERRTLVSTTYRESLPVLRRADPGLRLGWSVPRARRDYTKSVWMGAPALALMSAIKLALPYFAGRMIRAGSCEAVMAHWRLVGPALVAAIDEAGGELYAWTVDHGPRIAALEALGVTGVITNDPRLFQARS